MIIRIEGPYYGSYSLSIVNRMHAISLAGQPDVEVWISSTEAENYKRDEIAEKELGFHNVRYVDIRSDRKPDVIIRNTWPINHNYISENSRKIRFFAWEESSIPIEIIDGFNNFYDEIWVPSNFVKQSLIGSGAIINVDIVPHGIEKIKYTQPKKTDKFRLLHISSCFPRKSPDILIPAFIDEFSQNEDVELTIKTFTNPHNNVLDIIEHYRSQNHRNNINVIEGDYSREDMENLYVNNHFFVFPSRGEGFGLPVLESHSYGRGAIIPMSTSLSELFIPGVDISVDFIAEYSRSHLASYGSIWFSPKYESLRLSLRKAYEEWDLSDHGISASRIDKMSNLSLLTWSNVASHILDLLKYPVKGISKEAKSGNKIAIISSIDQACGISSYSSELISRLPTECIEEVVVIAPITRVNDFPPTGSLGMKLKILRCWDYWGDVFEPITTTLEREMIDSLYIQHHTGFFSPDQLKKIIKFCLSRNIFVVTTFHSFFDDDVPESQGSYIDIVRECGCQNAIFYVHSVREYNLACGLPYLFVFPQGAIQESQYSEQRPLGNSYIVSSFGFLRRHKGIRELILAWSLVLEDIPGCRLVLLCSEFPSEDSKEEVQYCRELILNRGLVNNVLLSTTYYDLSDVSAILGYSDVVVFPYHEINEGSSSAVRVAISSHSTILCSDIPLFDEFGDAIMRIDLTVESIASAIIKLITDRNERERLRAATKKIAPEMSWDRLSRLYWSRISR
jgi:glycosyltransferase involved in cell wall biosynthesis